MVVWSGICLSGLVSRHPAGRGMEAGLADQFLAPEGLMHTLGREALEPDVDVYDRPHLRQKLARDEKLDRETIGSGLS